MKKISKKLSLISGEVRSGLTAVNVRPITASGPRKSARRPRVWLTLATLLGALGCAGEIVMGEVAEENVPVLRQGSCRLLPPEDTGTRISVGTFWRDSPDAEALDHLEERASQIEANLSVIYYKNRQALLVGLKENPVDVFQVNGGFDVLQFATDDSEVTVCGLDDFYEKYDVWTSYFSAALQPVTCGGVPYALPLNIHRLNTVMVNLDTYRNLQDAAALAGESVPDFENIEHGEQLFEILELAQDLALETTSGQKVVPLSLCLGTRSGDAWPLPIVAFEGILASYANEAYEAIWRGEPALSRDDRRAIVERLVEDLTRLSAVSHLAPEYDSSCPSFVSEIPESHTWQRAAELVRTGEALLTIGGDWLRGLVPEAERLKVDSFPYPGQQDTFIYTPDTFAAPFLPDTDGSAAHVWLTQVVGDRNTQVGFAKQKQAIPAVSNLDAGEIQALGSDYLIGNYLTFQECHETPARCRLLLAVSGLAPAAGSDPCFDRLGMLAATAIGLSYTEADWLEYECPEPIPQDQQEARQALVELLLDVSDEPFGAVCPQ